MDQTYSWSTKAALVTVSLPVTVALGIGTGGVFNPQYYRQREAGLIFPMADTRSAQPPSITSTADEVEFIRSTLKLTFSELADCVGVTRQAVYNWKAGAVIKADNAAKLESLRKAAEVVAAANVHASPLLLGRKLPTGKTLLDSISSGDDGFAVASALVSMLRRESHRRAEIAAKFSGRSPVNTGDDAPSAFDEDV